MLNKSNVKIFMTKKLLISCLQASLFSLIFLFSCRSEDDALSVLKQERLTQEYNNKSFWKEDEVFIQNVQKIFNENLDNSYFSNKYGKVYWNYAMTFDKFDESFLEVPIIKNNKVEHIMFVNRIDNKIYFHKKTDDDSSRKFFQTLVFKDRESLKPSVQNTNSPVARGTICITREITWTWTDEVTGEVLYTDSYSTTTCLQTDVQIPSTCLDPSGDCSGTIGSPNAGGGGGGGYTYPTDEQPTEPQPCEKIKAVGKDSVTKNSMKNLKTKTNDNKEHAYFLWEDTSGNSQNDIYGTGPVGEAGVRVQFNAGDKFAAFIHSHYQASQMLSTFSFDDFITLCTMMQHNAIKDVNTFVAGVVTPYGSPQGNQYYMVIDDPSKFASFASQFFANGIYDKEKAKLQQYAYDQSVNYENTATENEKNLVNYLQVFDTGLQVMKGDNEMNNWSLLTKNSNGTIVPINCNN